MTTKYLALDRDGLTAPAGKIAGISDSAQGLIDAGFAAATYTGDRAVTIDTTDDTKWKPDCQVGWYYTEDGSVQQNRPASELDLLKSDVLKLLDSGDAVRAEITRLGPGQDAAKTEQAHQTMWRARGGTYLIALDRSRTVAERRAWAQANILGPTDVTGSTLTARVLNYFTHFSGNTPTNWITFADPDTAARTTLANAPAVTGTIAADVDLVDRDWVDNIEIGTGE